MHYFSRYLRLSKQIHYIFQRTYGISTNISFLILKDSGIHPFFKINKLNLYSYSYPILLDFFKHFQYYISEPLRREYLNNIKHLISIRMYRGVRHKYGYPSRGQRTRTNASTKKHLFSFYAKKSKTIKKNIKLKT
jgi:small subunit ribosomal protein S13